MPGPITKITTATTPYGYVNGAKFESNDWVVGSLGIEHTNPNSIKTWVFSEDAPLIGYYGRTRKSRISEDNSKKVIKISQLGWIMLDDDC